MYNKLLTRNVFIQSFHFELHVVTPLGFICKEINTLTNSRQKLVHKSCGGYSFLQSHWLKADCLSTCTSQNRKSYMSLRYFRSSVQVNRQCSLEYHGFMYVLTQSRSQSLLSSYGTCSMKMKALERSNPKVILIGYLKCNTIQ